MGQRLPLAPACLAWIPGPARCGRSQLVRAIRELAAAGHIEVQRRGRGLTNLYRFPAAKKSRVETSQPAEPSQIGTASGPAVGLLEVSHRDANVDPGYSDSNDKEEDRAAREIIDPPAEVDRVWQAASTELARQFNATNHRTFIAPARLAALDGNTATIAAPSVFVAQQLDRRYRSFVTAALARAAGRPVSLTIVAG